MFLGNICHILKIFFKILLFMFMTFKISVVLDCICCSTDVAVYSFSGLLKIMIVLK